MAERPEDLSLPLASISRVINDAVPSHCNVSMETRKSISRAASVFVLYTTASAATIAQRAGRKTLNANDVLEAVNDMDFPQFKQPLMNLLEGYKQTQKKRKSEKETNVGKKKVSNNSSSAQNNEEVEDVVIVTDSD